MYPLVRVAYWVRVTYTLCMFKNLEEVKTANTAIGEFWFSTTTVTYFKGRIESELMDGRYWVESIKNADDTGRQFIACVADQNGRVSYVPDTTTHLYETKQAALDIIETARAK